MQSSFVYDHHIIAKLRRAVSAERLQRYEAIVGGDSAQALQLYVWNTAVSEALYGPIQGVEITLRNKIHEHFVLQFGPRWYDTRALQLQHIQQHQVMRAKQSLLRQRKPPDPPRVVAE